MKEVDHLTIHIPPLPHVASFHPKDMYCYHHPCIDDPKKHYGFKLGLLRQSGSLGADFSNMEMIENDWELESKDVSFLGRGLNSPVRPKEVDKISLIKLRAGNFSLKTKRKSSQCVETVSGLNQTASRLRQCEDLKFFQLVRVKVRMQSYVSIPSLRMCTGNGYHTKDKKKAKNKQNRARDEKDNVKSKPKSVKIKGQPSEENTT
ncbi:hypothetical protein Tco_0903862 [Tanacetum coccineum]